MCRYQHLYLTWRELCVFTEDDHSLASHVEVQPEIIVTFVTRFLELWTIHRLLTWLLLTNGQSSSLSFKCQSNIETDLKGTETVCNSKTQNYLHFNIERSVSKRTEGKVFLAVLKCISYLPYATVVKNSFVHNLVITIKLKFDWIK